MASAFVENQFSNVEIESTVVTLYTGEEFSLDRWMRYMELKAKFRNGKPTVVLGDTDFEIVSEALRPIGLRPRADQTYDVEALIDFRDLIKDYQRTNHPDYDGELFSFIDEQEKLRIERREREERLGALYSNDLDPEKLMQRIANLEIEVERLTSDLNDLEIRLNDK